MSFIDPEIDWDLWLQPGWDFQEASLPQSDFNDMRLRQYYQEASATIKPPGFVLPDEMEIEATSTGLPNRYNDCAAVLEASLAAAKDNVTHPNTLGGADKTSVTPDFIMQSTDLESFKDVLSGEFRHFSNPGEFGDFDSLLAPSIREYPASGAQTQATGAVNNLSQVLNPISSPFVLPWNACPQLPGGKSCGALSEQFEASLNFTRDDSKISNLSAFAPRQYPQPFLVDDGGAASTTSYPISKQRPMLLPKQVTEVIGPFEADRQSTTGIYRYSNLTQASIAQTTVNDLPSDEVSNCTGAPRIKIGSVKGSKKRSLVVQMPPSNKRIKAPKGVPQGLCTGFSARLNNVAQISTRERSKRVCLRCRDQNLKCSGQIPSTNCQDLLSRAVARKSRSTIFGIPCIESDLVDLNLFLNAYEEIRSREWQSVVGVHDEDILCIEFFVDSYVARRLEFHGVREGVVEILDHLKAIGDHSWWLSDVKREDWVPWEIPLSDLWFPAIFVRNHLEHLQKSITGLRRKQITFQEKHDLLVYLIFLAYFTNDRFPYWVSPKSCKHLQGYLQHYILKLLKELPISVLAANLPTESDSSEYDQMSDKTSAEALERRLQQLIPSCFQRLSEHLTKSKGRISFDVIVESCTPIWRVLYWPFRHVDLIGFKVGMQSLRLTRRKAGHSMENSLSKISEQVEPRSR